MSTDAPREVPAGYVDWEDLKRQAAAARTPEQQREYDEAEADADAQIALTELVYNMRTRAGLSQTELARRLGAAQPYISAIERGVKVPTVQTLSRIARATGNRLRLVAEPA